MHIKAIKLYNYKSYKGETTITDIQPGHNIIVGENGSGKSNILSAMQFVITLSRISHSKKRTYITCGCDQCYVEIVFTNCEFGGDLHLKRCLDVKEDGSGKYFINGTLVPFNKMKFLLDILGFHFRKPHLFLTSALAHDFCGFSIKQRLKYLVRNMDATIYKANVTVNHVNSAMEGQKPKMDHIQSILDKNFARFAPDNAGIAKIHDLTQAKTYVEILIYQKQIKRWKRKQTDLEEIKKQYLQARETITNSKKVIENLKLELKQIKDVTYNYTEKLENLRRKNEEVIKSKEKIGLILQSLDVKLKYVTDGKPNAEFIDRKIKEVETELDAVKEQYTNKTDNLYQLELNLDKKYQEQTNYLTILIKEEQFLNQEQKDNWLKSEIMTCDKTILNLDKTIESLNNNCSELSDQKRELQAKIDVTSKSNKFEVINRRKYAAKQLLDRLQTDMSESRRNEHITENKIYQLKGEINAMKIKLDKKIGRSTLQGIESVEEVVENWRMSRRPSAQGYIGLVIDHIRWEDPRFNTPLEVTLGKKLFYHLVINDNVGTEILGEMKHRQLAGEVYFLPLNRILRRRVDSYHVEGEHLLYEFLNYPDHLENAVKFLLGNVYLCRDLDVAITTSHSNRRSFVSLEGDQVQNTGVISGGYINKLNSSMNLYFQLKKLQNEFRMENQTLANFKSNIQHLSSKIEKTVASIEQCKIEAKSQATTEESLMILNRELKNIIKQHAFLVNQKRNNELLLEKEKYSRQNMNDKLKEEFLIGQTVESEHMVHLNEEINQLKKSFNKKSMEVQILSNKKIQLENEMEYLYKTKNLEMDSTIEAQEYEKKKMYMLAKRDFFTEVHSSLNKKIENIEEQILEAQEREKHNTSQLEKWIVTKSQHVDGLILLGNHISKFYKIEEYKKLIVNHDTLISEKRSNLTRESLKTMRNYRDYSINSLLSKLADISKQLALIEKTLVRNGVGVRNEKILKLLEEFQNIFCMSAVQLSDFCIWLDRYINIKLRALAEYFSLSFSQIYPNGSAYMFLDDDNSNKDLPTLSKGTGIYICIDLPDRQVTWTTDSLSTSQKVNLCAALMLAFAKIFPTPFCLMDEVDQTLTINLKQLLGLQMSQLEDVQTFSVSHSPDWVSSGSHFYKVTFSTRMSSMIRKVTKNDALETVKSIPDRSWSESSRTDLTGMSSSSSVSSPVSSLSSRGYATGRSPSSSQSPRTPLRS